VPHHGQARKPRQFGRDTVDELFFVEPNARGAVPAMEGAEQDLIGAAIGDQTRRVTPFAGSSAGKPFPGDAKAAKGRFQVCST
jgi:hypothetical protein